MFKRVAEDSETIFRFLHFSVEFIPSMVDCRFSQLTLTTTPEPNKHMTTESNKSVYNDAVQRLNDAYDKMVEARDKAIWAAVYGDEVEASKARSSYHAAYALHKKAEAEEWEAGLVIRA